MLPAAWANGQYQHGQQHSQSSQSTVQLTQNSVRSLQDGVVNNVSQFGLVSTGVGSQQTNYAIRNGIMRQTHGRTSATKTPSGNYCHLVNNATLHGQVAALPHGHQTSGHNLSTQNPPNTIRTHTTYHQQDMPAHGSQFFSTYGNLRVQNGNPMSNNVKANAAMLLSYDEAVISGTSAPAIVQIRQTAQSQSYSQNAPQVVCSSTSQRNYDIQQLSRNKPVITNSLPSTQNRLASSSSHINSGVVATSSINVNSYNQSTQQGVFSSTPRTNYNIPQSSRNKPVTTNSLARTHNYHTSSSSHINGSGVAASSVNMTSQSQNTLLLDFPSIPPPNYNLPQLSRNEPVATNALPSTQNFPISSRSYVNSAGVATSSSNMNSYGNQYETSHLATHEAANTGQHILRQLITANSTDNIIFTTGPNGCSKTYSRSPYDRKRSVCQSNPIQSNQSHQTMLPVTFTAAESCNSNISELVSRCSGQSLAENTRSMPALRRCSTDALLQQSFASEDFSVTPTRDGRGNALNTDSVLLESSTVTGREIREKVDKHTTLYTNDNSIHSSPGRLGQRAVAVVQPLSQECYQVASDYVYSNTLCQYAAPYICLPEGLKEGSMHLKENPIISPEKQSRTIKSLMSLSESNNGTFVASSESPWSQNSNQKPIYVYDRGSELSVNMQMDQGVAQPGHSEAPVTQNGAMDKSEVPADPESCVVELSAIPTIKWTAVKLHEFLQYTEKAERSSETSATCEMGRKILSLFWDGTVKSLSRKLKEGWYKDLITDIYEFYAKHVNRDTVILSQVEKSFEKELRSHHVLRHNEIYADVSPYISSWLNINVKLDEIDEEFGFPWSLRPRLVSDIESQQDSTSNSTLAEISSEAPNKPLSETEPEPADSNKEEHNTDEDSPNQCVSSSESSASSNDPHYSFKIHVLPPEEAKVIFEQNKIHLKEDSLPEKDTESCSKGDSPIILNGSLYTRAVSPIQQVCCMAKWTETVLGLSSDCLSKCQCKKDASDRECTEEKFTSARKREKQAQAEENGDNDMTFSWPEICDKFILNVDLTEDDNTPPECEPWNVSLESVDNSSIFISDDKDEKQLPNQMQSPKENSELAPIESPGSSQCGSSEETEEATVIVSSDNHVSGPMLDIEVDGIQPELNSREMLESQTKEGQTQTPVVAAFPTPVSLSVECEKDTRTVELVLFGSKPKGTCVSIGSRQSQFAFPDMLPDGAQRPPKVLSVKISPLKRTSSETVRMGNYSVKRRLYEKWRRSLPPPTIRHNWKLKGHIKLPLYGASFMKAKTAGPITTEQLPLSLKIKTRDANGERFLGQKKKKRRFLSLRRKRKDAVPLHKPAERENPGVVPRQENGVLGFSVLPKTFSFKDGSKEDSNTTDSVSDEALLAEAEDESSSKALKMMRGTWCPSADKKYSPLHQSAIPKTSSVFQEFQKRFKKKMQTPMAK